MQPIWEPALLLNQVSSDPLLTFWNWRTLAISYQIDKTHLWRNASGSDTQQTDLQGRHGKQSRDKTFLQMNLGLLRLLRNLLIMIPFNTMQVKSTGLIADTPNLTGMTLGGRYVLQVKDRNLVTCSYTESHTLQNPMVRLCQNGAICGEQQSWLRRDLTHTVSSASTRLVPIIPEGPLLSQPTTYSPFSMVVPSVPWPLLNTRPFAFGTRPVKTKWNDKHQHHYQTTRALFGPFSCMPGNINFSINCSLCPQALSRKTNYHFFLFSIICSKIQ